MNKKLKHINSCKLYTVKRRINARNYYEQQPQQPQQLCRHQ